MQKSSNVLWIRLAALSLALSGVSSLQGAETFGLHAIGQEAIREKNPALLSLVNSVRMQEGLVFFIPGLVLLAVGTSLLAIVIWRSNSLPNWSGIPLAVSFVLYLPQFF